MILFDVCDYWTDPVLTASKMGKKLGQVVRVGDKVVCHAALLNQNAKIKYLASSVWPANDDNFSLRNRPRAIKKENIHKDKINIYNVVVEAVSKDLPELTPAKNVKFNVTSPDLTEDYGLNIINGRRGTVKLVFFEGTELCAGIIELDNKQVKKQDGFLDVY